jgi:hypothetical protein
MTEYNSAKILTDIEHAMEQEPPCTPEPVNADKWLLSSMYQKSVRRGEHERALRAAYSLWRLDKDAFWRRCHVLALEDVGMVAPDAVVPVLVATSSAAWRRRTGNLQVALHLTRIMCSAAKTRVADEILMQAEKAKHLIPLRCELATADDSILTGYVMDERRPLVERCLSLWYLAGTQRFTTDNMPQRHGSMDKAIEVMRAVNAPASITESCIAVLRRTQWALSLFSPLIHQHIQRLSLQHRSHDISPAPEVDGVPCYAADWYTRTGRTCFQRLRNAVPPLKSFSTQQVGCGIFYADGQLIDRTMTAPELDEIRLAGEEADMGFTGLSPAQSAELKQILRESMGLLTEIRLEQLRRYLPTVAKAEAYRTHGAASLLACFQLRAPDSG